MKNGSADVCIAVRHEPLPRGVWSMTLVCEGVTQEVGGVTVREYHGRLFF